MEILTTTGIALSSLAAGEADIICNYYTRDAGKRRFIFKGLKKSKKRSRSAVEPGSIATLVYYYRDDRDSYFVNDVSVEKYYPAITADLNKIMHLYFLLETVDKTCGYNIADEGLFRLLSTGIEALSKTGHPAHLAVFFILRLLESHGILTDMNACKMCGKTQFQKFTLDITDLRPVCLSCLSDNPSGPWHGSALLPESMRVYARSALAQKFSMLDNARFGEHEVMDLLFNCSLFIENYFHIEIKSKQFAFSERFR